MKRTYTVDVALPGNRIVRGVHIVALDLKDLEAAVKFLYPNFMAFEVAGDTITESSRSGGRTHALLTSLADAIEQGGDLRVWFVSNDLTLTETDEVRKMAAAALRFWSCMDGEGRPTSGEVFIYDLSELRVGDVIPYNAHGVTAQLTVKNLNSSFTPPTKRAKRVLPSVELIANGVVNLRRPLYPANGRIWHLAHSWFGKHMPLRVMRG